MITLQSIFSIFFITQNIMSYAMTSDTHATNYQQIDMLEIRDNDIIQYLDGSDITKPIVRISHCKNIKLAPNFFDKISLQENNKIVAPQIYVYECPFITGTTQDDPKHYEKIILKENPIKSLEKTSEYFSVVIEEKQPYKKQRYVTNAKPYKVQITMFVKTEYAIYKKPFAFSYLKYVYLLWEYTKRFLLPNIYFPYTKICTFTIEAQKTKEEYALTKKNLNGTRSILQ